MKHVFLLSSLLLAGGTILSSCSSDELFGSKGNVKRIEASICDFVMEDGATRTSYTLGNNGYEAVWATGDVLGIYPLGGDQVAFPISDGIGTTRAVFDGGAWALRGTYKYAAYYPFSQENYTNSETAIPVTYLGQTQSSNNATSHLANYDYMAAAATQPSSDGSVTLPFKHLGSYLILPLTLPKAGTYTQLTLTSDKGEFITKGTVDLSSASPAITATETSSSISLDLDNIVLTSNNLVLTVNMLIAPVNLTGSTITIAVKDAEGAIFTNKEKAWTRSAAFLANTTYKASRTLAGSGTGGSIEGGGGLEEDDDTPTMLNGHEYVDLGLKDEQGRTIYWATCNIGAENPEDKGFYFAWGEISSNRGSSTTDGYKFDWTTYNNGYLGNINYQTYWNSVINSVSPEGVLPLEYDAAYQNWGESWRMPTREEQEQLLSQCSWSWDANNKGYTVKGPNNNTIFLPAAGYRYNSYYDNAGTRYGYYWSSSIYKFDTQRAYFLKFDYSTGSKNVNYLDCCDGMVIRPVCVLEESPNMHNGHEYVDLGLPSGTLWATCNIGAKNEYDTGGYFAAGETKAHGEEDLSNITNYLYNNETSYIKTYYNWNTYKYSNGTTNYLTKYSFYCLTFNNLGINDDKYEIEPEDDAAQVNWEGNWRLPTIDDYSEIHSKCSWTWIEEGNTEFGGIAGYKVQSKVSGFTDNYIFLPVTGYFKNNNLTNNGSGYYWTSTFGANPLFLYSIYLTSSMHTSGNMCERIYGCCVRPVCVLSK